MRKMYEPYEELEYKFQEFHGTDGHMVACATGTAALHLAFQVLKDTYGWQDRSLVVVPDFTMIACPRAVSLAGLEPVFLDVNDWALLDPEIDAPEDTKAVLQVHTYGRHCSYEDASSVNRNWLTVNDLSEAHGLTTRPGAIDCWSFYKNKVIAGEEGGMVCFPEEEMAERAKSLRNMGFTSAHDFTHIRNGMNYRLSNVHASLILDSLKSYDNNLAARAAVDQLYDALCPVDWKMPPRRIPWVYDLLLPSGIDNGKVVKYLNTRHIAARVGFKRMSRQEEYRLESLHLGTGEVSDVDINPKAKELSERLIYLPIQPGMSAEYVRKVMTCLNEAVEATSQPG